ncbi:GNAT family N-acetyltransferase [Tabrizicola sp.]|uniref:GNAT family N-acetyltransferase n=1 Tax=Tabrizicola sp. TaxID=2005166 RepID=UPI003F2CCA21
MTPPTLHTERLTLRAPVLADFPAYAALMASPRSAGMGGPYDEWQAWGMFCHEIACWQLFGHGGMTVLRRDTGEAVGLVGLNAGPLYPETELGWQLSEGHEGQGYATEAARALLDWAFANLPVQSIVSYTGPDNLASQAVAKRLGAVIDPAAPVQDEGDIVWRHHRRSA